MRRSRRIALSTAVSTGVLGLAGVALAVAPGSVQAASVTDSVPSIDPLAAQKAALRLALVDLDGRTGALDKELAAAQARLAAARAAAAAAPQAAPPASRPVATNVRATPPRTVVYVHAPAVKTVKPPTHTTTGASGSGGGDDGPGDDGGNGGGSDD